MALLLLILRLVFKMKCKINYSRKSVVESYMNDNLDNKKEIQIHEHLRQRFFKVYDQIQNK